MANIATLLAKIKSAIYGEEVRGAIHDSIEAINDEVVSWTGLQDGTVTTAKLAGSAVTTAKIADGSVTRAKLNADVVDTTLAVSGAPADAKTTGDKVTDLKSNINDTNQLLDDGVITTSDFVQGARNINGVITANSAKCTMYKMYTLKASQMISVSNIDSGLKIFVVGLRNGTQLYGSGWQTADFQHIITANNDGQYFVEVAKVDGSNLSPSGISTLVVTMNESFMMDNVKKLEATGKGVFDCSSKVSLYINNSASINENGNWQYASGYRSYFIPVVPNSFYRIKRNLLTNYTVYGVVTTKSVVNNGAVSWATGTGMNIMNVSDEYADIYVPADGKYLVYNSTDALALTAVDIYELTTNEKIENIETDIKKAVPYDVNSESLNIVNGTWTETSEIISFVSNSNWRTHENPIVIPDSFDYIKIESNRDFFTSGATYSIVFTDEENNLIYYNTQTKKSFTFTRDEIPSNVKRIYVNVGSSQRTTITVEIGTISDVLLSLKIENEKTYLREWQSQIASGSTTGTVTVMPVSPPYFVKGFEYGIEMQFSQPVNISSANLRINFGAVHDGYTEQIVPVPSGETSKIDILFVAGNEGSKIDFAYTLASAPSVNVTVTTRTYIKTKSHNAIDKVSNDILSDTSAFLMSYTHGAPNEADSEPGKMYLGIGTSGMIFHKVSSVPVFDGSSYGEGFQHDIDIIEKDGVFYITGTSSKTENGNCVLTVFSSANLSDWTEYGNILVPMSSFTYESGNQFVSLWAPEILLLNGSYYLSFAVCENRNPYVVKGYIADLSNDLLTVSNVRAMTIDSDYPKYTFDTTFFYDEEKEKYYAMFWNCGVYESTSMSGTWKPVGFLPARPNGYQYMEAPTIIKENGWYFIYGDGTITGGHANNLLCWKTKDFNDWQFADKQFDSYIRHPKVIQINCLHRALAEKIYLDRM